MQEVPAQKIKEFTDQEIGHNYYTVSEIEDMVHRSQRDGQSASRVLVDQGRVRAVRISYPPGHWSQGKGQGLSPEKWPWPIEQTAYFQSLFVAKDLQNQGWGSRLSKESIAQLRKMGAQGVVCHSWVESPGDSSGRYLRSLNFQSICRYPRYWEFVDYTCPRCGRPCLCTAEEMYLDLQKGEP